MNSDKYKTNNYMFTIIISVYNTENYLKQSISSVVNQTIGFKDNVQLILINDGSTDNSLNILYNYQEQFPDNILVINQENMGQAKSRNNAISYAEGKYVNFLDSDDYLSENTLKEVYDFFEKNYNEIDLISIPQKFFGKINGEHILNSKFTSDKVIDLDLNPNNPQLSASSSFFKREVFSRYEFDEGLIVAEDAMLVNKVLLEKKKYALVSNVTYFYRKRENLTSTTDIAPKDKRYYTDKLKNFSLELLNYSTDLFGEVPEFIQYTLAYDLQWLLEKENLSLLNEDEEEEFWTILKSVIIHLSDKSFKNNIYIHNKEVENFFLYIKYDGFTRKISDKNNLQLEVKNTIVEDFNSQKIWIDIIELSVNKLNISGFVKTHFKKEHINIRAKAEYTDGTKYYDATESYYTVDRSITFLSNTIVNDYSFDVEIPLTKLKKVELELIYDENRINFIVSPEIKFMPTATLSTTSFYKFNQDKILSFVNGFFQIEEYSFKQLLKYELPIFKKIIKDKKDNYIKNLFNRFIFILTYPIIEKIYENKEIYLFMDRIDFAEDNAEALYKYALNQDDNIENYFILDEKSKDFPRIKKYPNILKFDSFKRKILYIHADKIISSHPDEFVLNPFFDNMEYIAGLIKIRKYFLQHGVTKDNISKWLRKYDKNLSLIVTVSDLEKESFLEPGYNYDENIIQTLGFPRFDDLNNNYMKKQIVYMPSWRWVYDKKEELFLNSEYYQKMNSLLSNADLMEFLHKHGYKLVFKPHPLLSQFKDLFEVDEKVIYDENKTYNELFKESSILITDYSSVAFDFAYMKKPLIYYQCTDDYHFDLKESYFKYDTMGFGDVIIEENILIDKIKYYVDNDSHMEEKYVERVDNFFKYIDKHNCERVFNWIKNN